MGLGGAYICYIIFTLRMEFWYNDPATGSNAGFAILLGIATQVSRSFPPPTNRELNVSPQCMGFSIAGLCRRFLVYPPSMIWQGNLAQIALNASFHREKNTVANGWRVSRFVSEPL